MCTPLGVVDTCELFAELNNIKKAQLYNKRLPKAEQSAVNMLVSADVHFRKY